MDGGVPDAAREAVVPTAKEERVAAPPTTEESPADEKRGGATSRDRCDERHAIRNSFADSKGNAIRDPAPQSVTEAQSETDTEEVEGVANTESGDDYCEEKTQRQGGFGETCEAGGAIRCLSGNECARVEWSRERPGQRVAIQLVRQHVARSFFQ
ncbi:MAG: hypothetical protein ACXV97_01555 [Chthoniobacterales bacterium]